MKQKSSGKKQSREDSGIDYLAVPSVDILFYPTSLKEPVDAPEPRYE